MRKVDIFNHIYPPGFRARLMEVAPGNTDVDKRIRAVPMVADLDVRFRVMDTFHDYQQVLSLPTPPLENIAAGAAAADLARAANDGMAELVARYPERFPAFVASLSYHDPEAAVREATRALDELGACGIQMFTNVGGVPMSDPRYLPAFELLAARDRPIWMHPYRGAAIPDYTTESRSEYEIWWTFGWPYETSAAMARLVFAGHFDRFPALKIITHHMGGMAPYCAGRIGHGWDQLGARTNDRELSAVLASMNKRPVDYFRMFYADTALFGAYDATACGLAFFGAGHVLFASDAPFDPENGSMYIRETIAVIDRLPISDEERQQIYWSNAVRLLKLA